MTRVSCMTVLLLDANHSICPFPCRGCLGRAFIVLLHTHDAIWRLPDISLDVRIASALKVWSLLVQNAIDCSKLFDQARKEGES